jgi:hypothetical protein
VSVQTRGRLTWLAAALTFTLVTACLMQLRYGYQAGVEDHLVLSLQGLQWGHPGFLVNDWFIREAPQPHVLFDVVTWVGAVTGQLSVVYLIWWVVGLATGGAATAVLATRWAPRHPVLAAGGVAGVLAVGPQAVLGSTTPALPFALPHEFGGFLAYLTGALLLTRRPRAAAIACVATAVVHVQIGALALVVCLLAVAVMALLERVWWWSTLAGALVSGGVVVAILKLRPVASDSNDFIEICHDVIPYHCDATTWPAGHLYAGFSALVAALLTLPLLLRVAARDGRTRTAVGLWTAVVVAPALGLAIGVLSNRFGVPVLGRLAASTNIFRLAVLLLPFAAWGLLAGFARLSLPLRIGWLPVAIPVGYGWLVPRDAVTVLPNAWHPGIAVVAAAAVGVLIRLRRWWAWPAFLAAATSAALLIVAAFSAGVMKWRPISITFVPDAKARAMGRMIDAHVPPGEVILVQPSYGVIRLVAGRSVVVDCKAVPYGGQAWRDYKARLNAIGGRGDCVRGGHPWLEVTTPDLLAVAGRYGARYLILTDRDERWQQAVRLGWRVVSRPDPATGNLWLLAAPGAPDTVTIGAGWTVTPVAPTSPS